MCDPLPRFARLSATQSGLAEFAFAMQGLGSGPISLFGIALIDHSFLTSPAARHRGVRDVGDRRRLRCRGHSNDRSARRDVNCDRRRKDVDLEWEDRPVITVFCRAEEGDRSFIALVVDAGTPGLSDPRAIDVIAPHPLGTVTFSGCRVHRIR